jgi:hypothetical protein
MQVTIDKNTQQIADLRKELAASKWQPGPKFDLNRKDTRPPKPPRNPYLQYENHHLATEMLRTSKMVERRAKQDARARSDMQHHYNLQVQQQALEQENRQLQYHKDHERRPTPRKRRHDDRSRSRSPVRQDPYEKTPPPAPVDPNARGDDLQT